MIPRRHDALSLGPDVIQLLLPHRRPFLMVDRITGYEPGEQPVLCAERQISANEEVFAGHFPHLHLWPGVYTIEGMGQTCNLLQVLEDLRQSWLAQGGRLEDAVAALRNLELGYTLHPGFRPQDAAALLDRLPPGSENVGVSGSVDVKLLQPVFAGQCLQYEVRRTHVVDQLVRYEVQAAVQGRQVAAGVMTAKIGIAFPRDPRRPE
jgi:3-hydroxyacyl-[acyl-carrier-protein] dehydratase